MLALGDVRFDSWKEIAAHLNRDVRTARRWEMERGLPVHRVPGTDHGGVFAYRSEIDAWLNRLNESSETIRDGATPQSAATWTTPGAAPVQVSTPFLKNGHALGSGIVSSDRASEDGATRQFGKLLSTKRTAAIIVAALLLGLILALQFRPLRDLKAAGFSEAIQISSVSAILPRGDQTIFIKGTGFGLQTRYSNLDSPFIAIRDKTANWAAGRIIPQNSDRVTLNVQSWADDQIVVSGFSGAYGSPGWELKAGDKIELAIWNPETGQGPALYHLTVSAQSK